MSRQSTAGRGGKGKGLYEPAKHRGAYKSPRSKKKRKKGRGKGEERGECRHFSIVWVARQERKGDRRGMYTNREAGGTRGRGVTAGA